MRRPGLPRPAVARLATLRLVAGLVGGAARSAASTRRHRADPAQDGSLAVDGPEGAVEIVRDIHGVPHVFASTAADAVFGQGFVHAQDRLFQLDMVRRLAAGRLAEVAGPGNSLRSDRFMRRLGLERLAAQDLASATPGDRALLEAYAAGVNAGIATLPALPPEYEVLDTEPRPFRADDPMLIGRLLTFSFGMNWDTELLRARLLAALGPRRAAALDPAYPSTGPTPTGDPHPAAADRLVNAYRAAVEAGLPSVAGSNAWAVAGGRTASGRPMLASDPHLEIRLPGLFHVTHLRGGDIDTIGADVAGVPGIAIGHTGTLAWGLTAGMADVSDCYIETVDPEDPERYRSPEGWLRAEARTERFDVRGGEAIEERVLETRHGPVIGPAIEGETRAVALRSTALEGGDLVAAFLGILRSRTPEDLDAALRRWPGATFNFVYAHVDGRIGYRLAGRIPRRAPGEGLLPRDGATSPGRPEALPFEELPRADDPPGGAVVSANNAPGCDQELGEEWCEPWRADRIATLLATTDAHDAHSFAAIQRDRRSEPLVGLRDLLIERRAVDDPAIERLLQAWDGALTPESAAAAVIATVHEEATVAAVRRLAGDLVDVALGHPLYSAAPHSSFHYRLQGFAIERIVNASPEWFEDEAARDRLLRAAVARALERLEGRLGSDRHHWHWGDLHRLRYPHMLKDVPALGRWFSRGPVAYGGDVNTVNQAGHLLGGDGAVLVVPSYRQIIDVGEWDRSLFQLSSGISGIPGHPRYDDCIDEYVAGRYRPLRYSREAIEQEAEARLVLEPRAPSAAREAAAGVERASA